MNTTSVAYIAGLNFYWRKHVKVSVDAGAQHHRGPNGLSAVVLIETTLGFENQGSDTTGQRGPHTGAANSSRDRLRAGISTRRLSIQVILT